jgi:putative Mg2+ transporter-C (MgtC) family protein
MLVALAAATFMVISTRFVYYQGYSKEDLVAADPSRIAASIVTGIGFLAGGAILRTGMSVQGLTTAAGLWLVAAIGMAAGGGMYSVSVVVTVLGVLALTILRRFEDKDILHRTISLTLDSSVSLEQVTGRVASLGAVIHMVRLDRDLQAQLQSAVYDLHVPQTVGVDKVVHLLEAEKGLKLLKVEVTR